MKMITVNEVKIFSSTNIELLEEEINQWINKRDLFEKIIERHVSTTSGVNDLGKVFINYTVIFFYVAVKLVNF